jgi:hypothetical protein
VPVRDRSLPQATPTRKRARPKLLAAAAFLLAVLTAVMPGSDRVALAAQTANVMLVTGGNAPIPLNGLYDSGVTLVNGIDNSETHLIVSDQLPLKDGLTIELGQELMVITALDPDPPSAMWVQRGAYGTQPTTHPADTKIWANIAPIEIRVSDLGERDSGAKLAAAVDADKFENSGATLAKLINSTETSLTVSDLHPLLAGRTVKLDAEQMYVSNLNPGWLQDSGATLANDVGIYQTVIPITDQTQLRVGWTVRVDLELMYIQALTEGSPDTMTVQRGYGGDTPSTHSSGKPIFAASPTLAGTVDNSQTVIPITDKDLLKVGWTALVDDELMYIQALTEGSPDTMTVQRAYSGSSASAHSSGKSVFAIAVALEGDVTETQTVIPITDQSQLAVGRVARLGTELMLIQTLTEGSPDTMTVQRAYGGSFARTHNSGESVFVERNTSANLQGAVQIYQTVVPISDQSKLSVLQTARVEGERMHITALYDGSPDTMTVERGYDNTPVSAHDSGKTVYAGPDRISVVRGQGGTPKASHGVNTPIYIDLRTLTVDNRALLSKDSVIRVGNEYMGIAELPEEQENAIKVSRSERGSTAASHSTGDHIIDADGLGAYQFTVTTDSVSAYLEPVYAQDGDLEGNTFVGSIEIGAECANAVDDDGDWKINDGCPAMPGAETGAQCTNAIDDDGDWKVNDGCPAVGTAETACADDSDDDSDGWVNDGCPAVAGFPETGTKCNNAIDDDLDGWVNDGCPGRGLYSSSLQVTDSSLQFSQATTGTEPGSTGSGTLATFTLQAKQLTATLNLCALVSVALVDVSADVIPSALQSCQVAIVKCPDVNSSREVNIVDVLQIAQVCLAGYPPEPKYDINNNGLYNITDVLIAAKLAFNGPKLRCVPP